MSTDMHLELAALDARLRGANLGRDLHAPQELFAFVDTVPETHRPAPRVELVLGDHVRLRRSVFGLVAAAAVVAAIVGSALLMSIRNGQPAAPSDPHAPVIPGWTWLRADGTKTFMIFRVGNGYLSEPCGEVQTSLPPTCSSADALHWTMPASAAVAGSWDPEPAGILRTLSNHGKTYLATGYYVEAAPPQTCENPPDCTKSAVWRSTDGVHWKGIDLGVNPPWSSIYAFPSGFV